MKYIVFALTFVLSLHFAPVLSQAEATAVPTSEELRCYQCNSATDGDKCMNEDVMKKDTNINKPCAPGMTMCRKIRQWVDYEFEGLKAYERVVRTCGNETTNRACYYRAGFGGRVDVCTCYESLCNGASTLFGSSSIVLVVFLVVAENARRVL